MEIKNLKAHWDCWGRTNPFWAILSDPPRKGGKWSDEGFFETGRREAASVMGYLRSLPVEPGRGRMLDFGCGVGRLTQAFCDYFAECHGVDIAPSMIELADRYNRRGAAARYHCNDRDDLSLFGDGTFCFVYSNLVLQHMEPAYSRKYIREFLRVLQPGGIALFQLPGEPVREPDTGTAAGETPALPPSGFRARIRPITMPEKMRAGQRGTVRVSVWNLGDAAWPAARGKDRAGLIQLGNHWLDREGNTVCNDDGRAPLGRTVEPGEQVELTLAIRAPGRAGRYLLELDMVQEHVAWFQSRGSKTSRGQVTVAGRLAPGQAPPDAAAPPRTHGRRHTVLDRLGGLWRRREFQPVIEMYGIPQPEVLALIDAAGGLAVDVHRYDVSGAEWKSYRYCVQKPQPAPDR